jgi:hypothetical protein
MLSSKSVTQYMTFFELYFTWPFMVHFLSRSKLSNCEACGKMQGNDLRSTGSGRRAMTQHINEIVNKAKDGRGARIEIC